MSHNINGIIKSIRDIMRTDGLATDMQRMEQLGWMMFLKIFDDKDYEFEMIEDNYISPIPSEFQWRNWASNDEGMTGDDLLNFVNNKLFPSLKKLTGFSNRSLYVREVFSGTHNLMRSGTELRKVINKLNQIDFNKSKDKHLFGDIYEKMLEGLGHKKDSGAYYTPRAITQLITEIISPKLGEIIFDPACGTGGFLVNAIEYLKSNGIKTIEDKKILDSTIKGIEDSPIPYMLGLTNLILHDIEMPNIICDDTLLVKDYNSITGKDKVDCILANPPFGGTIKDGADTNFPLNYRTKETADLFLILMIAYLKDSGRAGIVLPDGSLTGDGVKQRIREKLLTDCNLHTIVRLPNSVFQPYASVATNLLFFTKGTSTKEIWYYEHKLPEGQKAYSKTKPIKLEEFEPLKLWWNNREENEQAWKVDIETIKANGYSLDIKNPHKEEVEHSYTSSELLEMLSNSFAKSNTLLEKLKSELS